MHAHCKKGFVILTIIFSPRVATVDMILWEDTVIVPHGQYSAHGVATGTIKFATRVGKIVWTSDKCYMQQKGIVPCHVNCSTNYLCSK